MLFRLLECERCLRRHWLVDGDPLPTVGDGCTHRWWERFSFRARDNGPGLHPSQVDE